MPRIKKNAPPPSTALADIAIVFTDSKRNNILLHHDELSSKTFVQLEDEITQAGGKVVGKVEVGVTTHLVATPDQYQKKGARVNDAIKNSVPIVSYDWLVASLNSTDLVDVSSYLLHAATPPSASNDPTSNHTSKTNGKYKKRGRSEDENEDQQADTKKVKAEDKEQTTDVPPTNGASNNTSRKTIVVPIDKHYPDQHCKVFQDEGGVYLDATLNQTESGKNANKFYRLQMLQHADGQCYTWTRWGRVGEDPGQKKALGDGSIDTAVIEFEKKFKDKTGLRWADRDAAPKPKKYTMIEINYAESDEEDDLPGAGPRRGSKESIVSSGSTESVESKLPEAVGKLMSLIFNNDYFNSTLAELEYDVNKMPLGKLSKKTLLKGYEVLKDLSSRVTNAGPGLGEQNMVETLSNQYYSLIPHAFGRAQRPPVLARMDLIKKEVTLLENLTDMQLANEIMKTAKTDKAKADEKVALVDRQYRGLGMQEMTPLDPKTTEFQELSDYLIKSAGSTHYIKYEVQDIFRIERSGEGDRFNASKFASVPKNKSDRRLLWHGSRATNFGGILSQGLRIAPPEAPVTAFTFGVLLWMLTICR